MVEFTVNADPQHAFRTWVDDPLLWWPRSHTRSGDPERIVFEPHLGGRVYEVDRDGEEHDWGAVLEWAPPTSLRLSWHHVFTPEEATDLHVTFIGGADVTTVRLVQTGWDRLGTMESVARRNRTVPGWTAVTTPYRQLLVQGA